MNSYLYLLLFFVGRGKILKFFKIYLNSNAPGIFLNIRREESFAVMFFLLVLNTYGNVVKNTKKMLFFFKRYLCILKTQNKNDFSKYLVEASMNVVLN